MAIRKSAGFEITLLSLSTLILFAAWAPAADIRGEFSFWITVDKVEGVSEGVRALTGKVLDFQVRVLLNADTSVQDASGESLHPDSIAQGAIVMVRADWQAEGFVAKTLSVSNPEQIIVTGLVEDTSADRIRVANVELKLNDQTAMDTVPSPGQMVRVHGRPDSDGSLRALSVLPQAGLKFFGKIEKIEHKDGSETVLQVASRTLRVTETAIIESAGKEKLTIADLKEGQFVNVEAEMVNGQLVARRIQVSDPKSVGISGTLVAFDAKSVSIKVFETTFVVNVDANTVIVGTLTVGMAVSVTASLQADTSLLALKIKAAGETTTDTKGTTVAGIIEKIGTSSFQVAGTTVHVNDKTAIVSAGKTLQFSDLRVGDKVSVAGTKQPDGSLLATKIEAMAGGSTPATSVEGQISSKDVSSMVVSGVKVMVDGKTVIVSAGRTIGFGDLKVGDKVAVAGTKQADGSVLAAKIEVMAGGSTTATSVEGQISSKDVSSMVVSGVKVMVDSKTMIVSAGRTIGFGDLKVGDKVAVAGTKQADGSLLATKVEVLSTASSTSVSIEGTITALGSSDFMVGEMKVVVDGNTAIVSPTKTLKFSDLKVGDKVYVAGTKTATNQMLAMKVKLLS